jgi:pimeloyl-ACP methyl ester carboxylesterase
MILAHREYGENGPFIVILHGLFGQNDNWTSIARKLSETLHVFTFDLRNHGVSGHSDIFTYDAMAADVVETLTHLGIEKCHLIGHSMGGKVAMVCGQIAPENFESLLIADIGPKYYKPHHQEIIKGLQRLKLDELASRSEADKSLQEDIPDFGTRQFLLKNLSRNENNGFEWRFNLDVIANQIEEVGKAISPIKVQIPTLFYRGGKSRYILDEDFQEIKNIFSNATFATMDGAGHWLHAEKPDEMITTILEWVSIN